MGPDSFGRSGRSPERLTDRPRVRPLRVGDRFTVPGRQVIGVLVLADRGRGHRQGKPDVTRRTDVSHPATAPDGHSRPS